MGSLGVCLGRRSGILYPVSVPKGRGAVRDLLHDVSLACLIDDLGAQLHLLWLLAHRITNASGSRLGARCTPMIGEDASELICSGG